MQLLNINSFKVLNNDRSTWLSVITKLIVLLLLQLPLMVIAQKVTATGVVKDAKDQSPLSGAVVIMTLKSDTMVKVGNVTDLDGKFSIQADPGDYTLRVNYLGYKALIKNVQLQNDMSLGELAMTTDEKTLSEVEIVSNQVRMEVKDDTIQFNADAFKVNPDATAEDLIKKMPGVTVEGNTIKVNGEEVKKVLVDGKPFFSDDPSATLKSLPAEILNNIQFFDQQSDQAMFTGFKDGNEEFTINLKTKPGMNVGTFGKVYAGYGPDDKYNAGAAVNRFNGSRKFSVLGMSNNINQQNFAISDIMGATGNTSAGQGGGGGTRGQGGGGRGGAPRGGGGGMGNVGNFMNATQGGITTSHALGLNYIDVWGKKTNISASYFFNVTDNNNNSSILRDYYFQDNLQYSESSRASSRNINHRANIKFEYQIDSLNKLTITPRFTYQQNDRYNSLNGTSTTPLQGLFSRLTNTTDTDRDQYNFTNDVLFQHKFLKKGRTFSVNVNTQISENDGGGRYYTNNQMLDTLWHETITDQNYVQFGRNVTWGGNVAYTEPIGKDSRIMLNYTPSFSQNKSTKEVWNVDPFGEYTVAATALYNIFDNNYNVQKAGVAYNYQPEKYKFSIGTDVQQAELSGEQLYPQRYQVEKKFNSLLPNASFNYKFNKSTNFLINYRTATRNPSITQLQNSIDQSNTMFVRLGNPDLEQTYENNVNLRFNRRLPEKESNIMFSVRGAYTNDYISNSTVMLSSDTVIQNVSILRGSQVIKPINVDGYYSVNAFGVYAFPVKKIKSNLNFTAGYTMTNTPALINDIINKALSNRYNLGAFLSSNISPSLDFIVGYNGSYTDVMNSTNSQSNNNYFNHNVTARLNYIYGERWVVNTDVNQNNYQGLSAALNRSVTLWNASIGYKMLKSKALEIKASGYDLLNRNTSINRIITETYTEDSRTQVLNRYFMLTLTYTFRHFKNAQTSPEAPEPGNRP
jgi:hypothetical protein